MRIIILLGFIILFSCTAKKHTLVREEKSLPVIEYLKLQSRFKHLLKPENESIIAEIQRNIDEHWAWLQMMEECTNKPLEVK